MSAEKIALVHSGEDYFERLIDSISKAQNEIFLQTYIFENDATGREVADALKAAALRHVKVFVLLDGYGSFALTTAFCDDLRTAGVNLRFFSPWHSTTNVYFGRRLHHKVVVVDAKTALIGGINIGDKYRGSATVAPWLDFAVQIDNEEIASSLVLLCQKIHGNKNEQNEIRRNNSLRSIDAAPVRIIRNDWLKRKKEISRAYLTAIRKAETEVIIVGSYFLPGLKLLRALKRAAQRGVKVKIVLSGVSDVPIVMRATQYLYPSLLRQGIELYEWKQSVLHGKIAAVDHAWATVGSFNLNHLSSYASVEMNVEIKSVDFSANLYQHLSNVLEQCDSITLENHATRSGASARLINWFAYRIIRLALVLVSYITYKRIRTFF